MDILLALYWSHIPSMQDCRIYTYLSMTFITEVNPRQVMFLIDVKKNKLCLPKVQLSSRFKKITREIQILQQNMITENVR
jgi:hypothetical protein